MDIIAEKFINHEFPSATANEKQQFISKLKKIDAVNESGYMRDAFFSLYCTFAGFDPENIEEQRIISVLNQGISSLPKEMLSWTSTPLIPTSGKISHSYALELAIGLCESDVINLSNYERHGVDFLSRFGQLMSPIKAINPKAINRITPEEFYAIRLNYYLNPLLPYGLTIGTTKDTPLIYQEWNGWIIEGQAPKLYRLLVSKWDSVEKAYESMRDVGYSPSPDDLERKRKEFQVLAGGSVEDLEDLAAAAPNGSDQMNLAGKFANLFNFDYSEHGLLPKPDHLIYGVEQNYIDFQQTLSPFVNHRNRVQVLDLIGCGKHHNFAGGKRINGGINEELLTEWGVTEKKILNAAVDIKRAKENEEPFTFKRLDQIIQERSISEDMALVLAFGFGLDNCVRHAISRLKVVAQESNHIFRNNFRNITGSDAPDISIVSTAELRIGRYWYYASKEGCPPILSNTLLSEIFKSA